MEQANNIKANNIGDDGISRAGGNCCGGAQVAAAKPSPSRVQSPCCGGADASRGSSWWRRVDWMLWISAVVVAVGYSWHLFTGHAHTAEIGEAGHSMVAHFAAGTFELMNTMWWGILLGIFFVGLLEGVPRDVIVSALTGKRRSTGIIRATAAGVLFDLCSHGILMVGMKLYERGASIGQTAAFLLASPWNSLSLTVILIALIGWWYTLLFILLSAVIAIVTGWLFDMLVDRGTLPDNPARRDVVNGDVPGLGAAVSQWVSGIRFSWAGARALAWSGMTGSRMVLRWLLFGVVMAAGLRAVLPADVFADWFGPTLLGVLATVTAATIIEVCSEGSTPLAADLVTRAGAPGNGFTFLMAGVATDYTEVMSLKDTTGSWKLALMLPVLAVPQTLLIGVLLNTLQ